MATGTEEEVKVKENESPYDTKSSFSGAVAAIAIGVVCVVIGIPLWWKTTEVYRVSLPYNDIANLLSSGFAYSPNVKIVICDETIPKYDIALFGEKLKESWDAVKTENINIEYRGNIRFANDNEKQAMKNATSLAELDELLQVSKDMSEHESYLFYILPKESGTLKTPFMIGLHRNIYLQQSKDLASLVPSVVDITRKTLINENELSEAYSRTMNKELSMTDKKESMRAFHSSLAYDVTFTLINPDPAALKANWNIKQGIDTYLKPLTDQIGKYVDITLKSEMLFYVTFPVQAKKDTKGFFLRQSDLPHLINPIEGKLASHVSNNPAVHFVTYLPTQKMSPLNIEGSSTNAFFSPRWGGMYIYNTAPSIDSSMKQANVDVDVGDLMEVFIPQLQMLLGLHAYQADNMMSTGDSRLPMWQIDGWLRARIIENIATASSSLKSLAQLLEKIHNMVINDEIGQQVVKAIQSINECERHLQSGQLIGAYHSSQAATAASEKAFFDPSLLELLYFPEDQKFAIYIPLFLPISIPVLLSAKSAFAYLKKARQEPAL